MKKITNKLLQLIIATFITGNLFAVTLHVGSGYPYPTLSEATLVAVPGDTIMMHSGNYAGGLYINNLQGASSAWICIFTAPGETVIYSGGSNAWYITDATYIHIKGFIFQQQTSNGFNMDDGGSYNTPSHHVIIDSCTFRNISATGNNDLLKMSGIDDFEIRNCIFLNGSAGGSGIDMVGCHDGLITGCHFENQGSNSIQAKGGCRNVRIERNFFKNGGQRSLNLGGSTGLPYFRPINATYEAADLKVYSNIFIGSDAPIAYVGCINTEVINNTFYMPTRWVIRILQETVDTTRFSTCGNNTFRNNIVYHDNRVATDCNVGSNTDPQSFTFSNNLWYHSQNAGWAGPVLPVTDINSIIGQNPLFVNTISENCALQAGSPAIGKGYPVSNPILDYLGVIFNNPRSMGALERNSGTGIEDKQQLSEELILYPNPFSTQTTLQTHKFLNNATLTVYNCFGQTVKQIKNISRQTVFLSRDNLASGLYFIWLSQDNRVIATNKLVIID